MAPLPFDYAHVPALPFGGASAGTTTFERARAVVLPIPLDEAGWLSAGPGAGPHAVLAASAQAQPNTIPFASTGVGSMPHLALELYQSSAKVKFLWLNVEWGIWFVIVVSMLLGAIMGWGFRFWRRHND